MSDRPCEICNTGVRCTEKDKGAEPGCPFKSNPWDDVISSGGIDLTYPPATKGGAETQYAHMEQLQRVCITWKNPRHDWPWYRLLGSLGELVHLQGADYPDGRVKHRGDSFWVHFSEIESMVDG